jgi:hypothetical protein
MLLPIIALQRRAIYNYCALVRLPAMVSNWPAADVHTAHNPKKCGNFKYTPAATLFLAQHCCPQARVGYL